MYVAVRVTGTTVNSTITQITEIWCLESDGFHEKSWLTYQDTLSSLMGTQ
jgi:hypothetical protein